MSRLFINSCINGSSSDSSVLTHFYEHRYDRHIISSSVIIEVIRA